LHTIFKENKTIITVEDNAINGGFGSAILEFAAQHNYKNDIKPLGIPDEFIEHGKVDELYKLTGLDVDGLRSCFIQHLS
jgi:1-deoxy-D-xylulose-5-phosphate synthase